jgi:hypothetical protein
VRSASDCIAPGACMATDDGGEFQHLRHSGSRQQPIPLRGSRSRMDAWLTMLSAVTANLKTWLAAAAIELCPSALCSTSGQTAPLQRTRTSTPTTAVRQPIRQPPVSVSKSDSQGRNRQGRGRLRS